MVQERAGRRSLVGFVGPDFLPRLEELFLDPRGVSQEGAVWLAEAWRAGGTVEEGASGRKLGGYGFPFSGGEMLMGKGLVGL